MAHAEQGFDIEEGIGPQEIDPGPVSVVVVFGAATTVILILLTIMFYNYMERQILETKGLDEPNEKVVQTVAAQRKQLESYAVVDAKKGTAQVPIETAMRMIVEQRTKDPNPHIVPVAPAKPGEPNPNKDAAKGNEAKKDGEAPAKAGGEKSEKDEKKEAPKAGAKKGDEKH